MKTKLIKAFCLGATKTNCYLIEHNDEHIMIDAGQDIKKVIDYLKKDEIILNKVLITHAHFDHIMGLNDLKKCFPELEVYVPDLEYEMMYDYSEYGNLAIYINNTFKYEHEALKLSQLTDESIKLFSVPGHSKDSRCFYFEEAGIVFSGDTLFKQTIGRCDLYGGNQELLIKNIKTQLLTLPDTTKVYPGHGEETIIIEEIQKNMFVQ